PISTTTCSWFANADSISSRDHLPMPNVLPHNPTQVLSTGYCGYTNAMSTTDHRSAPVQEQAHQHAERARAQMDRRRAEQDGGVSGWVAQRAGEWDLSGPDEQTMQRQKYFWNSLVDYWFRMEMDGWDNLPKPPALLIGIHSGAPFVWDAWTVGVQW